jgi:hypothetical protein
MKGRIYLIDLTSGIDLSPTKIEKIVSAERIIILETKDPTVELAARFPNMMATLWSYICTFRSFPTQIQFVNHYLAVHGMQLEKYDKESVKARLYRAYPSLVREIHFYGLAKESALFSAVTYSSYHDIDLGIDLQVAIGELTYNVSCYVLTNRAVEFRKRKITHRHRPVPYSIEMPLDLAKGKKIGDWVFFDTYHVHSLFNSILEDAWIKYKRHPLDLLCS